MEDYKDRYEKLIKELKWFENYHRTMADHYRDYNKSHLEELHETAWSEFYLLLERVDEHE